MHSKKLYKFQILKLSYETFNFYFIFKIMEISVKYINYCLKD